MTPTVAVLAPVLAIAAGHRRRCREGPMWDPRYRPLTGLLRPKRVVFRGRCVGELGIRCPRLGIRGRVFVGCIFVTAAMDTIGQLPRAFGDWLFRTFKSSHVVSFLTPSPTSLKPVLASSRRSLTLSRTRSVSRFVPRRLICWLRRAMLDVRLKSYGLVSVK